MRDIIVTRLETEVGLLCIVYDLYYKKKFNEESSMQSIIQETYALGKEPE